MNATKNIDIVNTQYAFLSNIPKCVFIDHYIFIDPVSGSNIYYPVTANGDRLDPDTEYIPTWILSSGPLGAACYQDYCFGSVSLDPTRIYCNTDVTFVLSAFDESVSEVCKVVYDFGDGSELLEVNYDFSSTPPISPKDKIIKKTYYPKNSHVTTYVASVSILKTDSCVSTLNIPICTFKCGIFDTYEDISLLNSQITTPTTYILLSLEKKSLDQIFNTLLLTNEPTTILGPESALPDTVNPVDTIRLLEQARVTRVSSPIPPTELNPVVPPASYLYSGCVGIGINFTIAELIATQNFFLKNNSLLLSGIGAPYLGGTGVTIGYECPPPTFPTTKVPSTPFIFNITSGVSSISIFFNTENDGSSATNYEYSLNGGATFASFTPPQSSSPLFLQNTPGVVTIEPGTTYNVVIRGTNSNGYGGQSNVGVITTQGYITAFNNYFIVSFNSEPLSLL